MSLIKWLTFLKAYRLKNPELSLQQAQKNALIEYKYIINVERKETELVPQ